MSTEKHTRKTTSRPPVPLLNLASAPMARVFPTTAVRCKRTIKVIGIWAVMIGVTVEIADAGPLAEVKDLFRAGQFEGAIEILVPMVDANPFNGEHAYYLGAALANSGRCEEALPYLDKALELGMDGTHHGLRYVNLRAAECAVRQSDHVEAATRIREAWARQWANGLDVNRLPKNELYDRARKLGLFDPLTGRTPEAAAGSFAVKQQADLFYFDRLIRETHPEPFHIMSETAWRESVAALKAQIPMDGTKFTLGLMRLAAMLDDGHTAVFPKIQGDGAWRLLPIYVRWFTDGWVIAAAAPEHAEIVGARIDGVNGGPIAEIVDFAKAALARENDIAVLWLGGIVLQTYEIYEEAGFASDGEVSFDLTLRKGEQRTVRLSAGPFSRMPNARAARGDWPAIGRDTLWLGNPMRLFSTHWFAERQSLYVQLNQMRDGPNQTMAEFGQSVFEELSGKSARSIIIDLRHNNGGETKLVFRFLRAIDRHAPLQHEGAIIALIGPRSFSATMAMAGRLERDMNAVFVGWPTGGRPSVYGTERPFTLPYSGITGTIPVMWHQDGMGGKDIRPWIPPDFAVWPSRADILAGRDPVLDQALEIAANAGSRQGSPK